MNVFVYGTLKSIHTNNVMLRGAKFIKKARTDPEFTLFNIGWFPGIVHDGTTAVEGELYTIDDYISRALDRYEGYPNLYDKEEIVVEGVPATVYTWQGGRDYVVIESGVWVK